MTRAPTSLYVLNLALLATHRRTPPTGTSGSCSIGILVAILVTSAAQLSLARRGIT